MKTTNNLQTNQDRAKVIAFYLPQYHRIPENDRWWGNGFTDWVNVKKCKPLFPGHYQPRIPLNNNYYDLTNLETLKWQVNLARKFHVHGFCHYHYWFDGKQLLEKPTNLFLSHKELDLPFCLAWANHTWARTWEISERKKDVLQLQTHKPDPRLWEQHFNYLIRFWKDKRAITIEEKPIFLIFQPGIIKKIDELFDFWKEKAIEHGLKGIYFIAMIQFDFINTSFMKYFDAGIIHQPAYAMYSPGENDPLLSPLRITRYLRSLPNWARTWMQTIYKRVSKKPRFHNYDYLWEKIIYNTPSFPFTTFHGAFVDWDNTARYGKRARIVRGANPEKFYFWFGKLVEKIQSLPKGKRLIFINAWNEWAEGNYLEPDEKYAYQYLQAIKDLVSHDESQIKP